MKKDKQPPARRPIISPKILYWTGLFIITVIFFNIYSKTFDYKIDMNGDNIGYYALGKSMAEGKGYVSTIGFSETPHNHFPPGYPFIISIAIRMGAGIAGVKMLNGLFLFLSCVVLYVLFYRITKNIYITFAAILLMAINPHLLRYGTIMMSEMPFLFFTSLALLLFSFMLERKKLDTPYYLLLAGIGICSVAAFYIRTVGMALAIAVICTLFTMICIHIWKNKKDSWKQHVQSNKLLLIALIGFSLFFLICKAPWDIRARHYGLKSSYISSITTQQGGSHISDAKGWVERVRKNTTRYITKELPSALFNKKVIYDKAAEGKEWMGGLAILCVILLGLFPLCKDDLLLFFYIGGTTMVLLVWPDIWIGVRFITPIIPWLMLLFIFGMLKICCLLLSFLHVKNHKLSFVSLLILLFGVYPNYSSAIDEAHQLAKYKDYTTANATPPLAEYLDAMRWMKVNIQDTGRVCTRKPELFYMYSGGRKSISFPNYAKPEEIFDYFKTNRIRYVIIDRWFRHAYVTVIPAAQLFPDNFKVIHQIGGTEKDTPPTYVLEFNPDWGYKGDMLDGKRHGKGVYAMQDGRTYTGSFVNDQCEGYGVMTDSQGNILAKGIWKNNSLVKPE